MTTITSLHSDLLISIAAYLTQVIDLIHLRSASKTIHQKLASTTPTVIRAKSRYATVSCTKNLKHACIDKQTFFVDRFAWTSRSARVIGTIKSGDVDAVKQLLGVEDDIFHSQSEETYRQSIISHIECEIYCDCGLILARCSSLVIRKNLFQSRHNPSPLHRVISPTGSSLFHKPS